MAEIGCTAEIITVANKYPDGRMDIVTEGRERFEVMQVNQERLFLQADVLYLRDEPSQTSAEDIAEGNEVAREKSCTWRGPSRPDRGRNPRHSQSFFCTGRTPSP